MRGIGETEREGDTERATGRARDTPSRRANGSAKTAERGRAISRARLALVVVVEVALAAAVVK